MNAIYATAIRRAAEIREDADLNMFQPVNVFDLCANLPLTVRFVDINMEGMYISQQDGASPIILLSNQRPLPRRTYTCAHELGHHIFGHGTRVDTLSDQASEGVAYDSDELLVDTFAGALMMPIAGVLAEFNKRKWNPAKASALDFFTISSVFGVGYQTLVTHSRMNGVIDESKKKELFRYTPAKILEGIMGTKIENSHFRIIDSYFNFTPIDLEVSNYVFLPASFRVDTDHLQKQTESSIGIAYKATKPGIVQIVNYESNDGYFIRIQKSGYIGLAEYRHLENEID
jgi:Zn-dependent peptidase ImmA (M78 family)